MATAAPAAAAVETATSMEEEPIKDKNNNNIRMKLAETKEGLLECLNLKAKRDCNADKKAAPSLSPAASTPVSDAAKTRHNATMKTFKLAETKDELLEY